MMLYNLQWRGFSFLVEICIKRLSDMKLPGDTNESSVCYETCILLSQEANL
jgi:hypothetical protein